MIVWTDAGEAARAGLRAAGVGVTDASPTGPAALAWSLVGSDRAPTVWHTHGDAAVGWPGTLSIVDDAPASQFVALHTAWADGLEVPDHVACIALTGAKFRGQRGRSWSALRGNLHLTVHLVVDVPAREAQAALAVAPVVALARAIERVTSGSVQPRVKWVNDLLLPRVRPDGGSTDDGVTEGKVAGVLTATRTDGTSVRSVLYGIGVNVARAPSVPPSPRALPPATLADVDGSFANDDAWGPLALAVLRELRDAVATLQGGKGTTLVEAYRDRAAFLGRDVTIWPVDADDDGIGGAPLAAGRCLAMAEDLSLHLEGHEGWVRTGRMTLGPQVR